MLGPYRHNLNIRQLITLLRDTINNSIWGIAATTDYIHELSQIALHNMILQIQISVSHLLYNLLQTYVSHLRLPFRHVPVFIHGVNVDAGDFQYIHYF